MTITNNAMAIEIKSNATPLITTGNMMWSFFLEVERIGVGEVEGEYEVVVVDIDEVVVVDVDEVVVVDIDEVVVVDIDEIVVVDVDGVVVAYVNVEAVSRADNSTRLTASGITFVPYNSNEFTLTETYP